MKWFSKIKAHNLEEVRRGWWRELLQINISISNLQYETYRLPLNSHVYHELRAQIWRQRHKLHALARKLQMDEAGAELPVRRNKFGDLPDIPEWLLRREVA